MLSALDENARYFCDVEIGEAGFVSHGAGGYTELSTLDEGEVAAPLRRAHLWMLRQDLAGYVVLGDPATIAPTTPTFTTIEEAIGHMLVGDLPAKVIAERHGIDRPDRCGIIDARYRRRRPMSMTVRAELYVCENT